MSGGWQDIASAPVPSGRTEDHAAMPPPREKPLVVPPRAPASGFDNSSGNLPKGDGAAIAQQKIHNHEERISDVAAQH